jgi:hypothetical protein
MPGPCTENGKLLLIKNGKIAIVQTLLSTDILLHILGCCKAQLQSDIKVEKVFIADSWIITSYPKPHLKSEIQHLIILCHSLPFPHLVEL